MFLLLFSLSEAGRTIRGEIKPMVNGTAMWELDNSLTFFLRFFAFLWSVYSLIDEGGVLIFCRNILHRIYFMK